MFHTVCGIEKCKFLLIRGGIRREDHEFPQKTICLTVLENFEGELIGVSLISRTENDTLRTILSGFSAENILSRCTETFRGHPSVLCFRTFLVPKKIIDK